MCHTIIHRCDLCASEAFREVYACKIAPDCGRLTEESKTTPFCQDDDRDREELLSNRTEVKGSNEEGNESSATEEDENSDPHEGSSMTNGKTNASSDKGSNGTNDGNGRTDEKSNGSDEVGSKSQEGSSGTAKRLVQTTKHRTSVSSCSRFHFQKEIYDVA